jgi:hypothetical protein
MYHNAMEKLASIALVARIDIFALLGGAAGNGGKIF